MIPNVTDIPTLQTMVRFGQGRQLGAASTPLPRRTLNSGKEFLNVGGWEAVVFNEVDHPAVHVVIGNVVGIITMLSCTS